jgi:hypothetical protein
MKVIPQCPNYCICDSGKVYSIKNEIYLKLSTNGNGYWKVGMYNPKLYQEYIHRLVAEAFIPNPENHKYIDHIDRDKNNNHVSNLRWVSAKENTDNVAGKSRYSVSKKGDKPHEPQLISEIRIDFQNGLKVMQISRKYGIPRQSVSRFIKDLTASEK